MAAIPIYQSETSIGGADLGPGPSEWSQRGRAAVGQGLTQGIGAVVDVVLQKREEDAIVSANDQLQQARQTWTENFNKAKDAAPPGAPDFTPNLLKAFDADAAERMQTATTAQSRTFLKQRLNDVRLGLYNDSIGFQANAQITDRVAHLATSTDSAKTAAEFHPENYSKLFAEQQATITASGLPAEVRGKATEYARTGLADAAARGMIRQDPTDALARLNDEKSTDPAINALDFKDREALRSEAEAEIRRREAEARQNQAQAWSAMSSRLADASAAYQRGLPVPDAPSYNEIAAVAPDRKDVDRIWLNLRRDQQMGSQLQQFNQMSPEQIAAARKGYAVTQGGFGAAEQLQRQDTLDQAAAASIRARVADPAGFAVQNGLGWHPLDFSNQDAVANEIRNRVNTQLVVSQKLGVAAPILSKGEAEQISAGVEAAKPTDALNLYKGMYMAAGSDASYASIMQQIAKDSPVRAIAGLRALRSQDIALTMLKGEDILNKTKASASQDGKPSSGLYLPNTTTLQQSFNDAVGSAFADHPEVAENSFQAVKAYYVGAAAKAGRLAADKSDIDGKIAQEAITNVLGTVVDYNGRGKVIAPWGMDAAAFRDRVQAAYLAQVKARGMPDYAAGQLSMLGLRSVGHDTYKFMVGDLPLEDRKGNQVIINVAPSHGISGTWREGGGASGTW